MVNVKEMNKAYTEVYLFLELLGDEYKNKISKKVYNYIVDERDKSYNPDIQEGNNLSKEALTLISALNLQYWCEDEEERRELKEVYSNNAKIELQRQDEETSPENLFKTSRLKDEQRERELEEEREANLIAVEEPKGIFGKIIAFFKGLFGKK